MPFSLVPRERQFYVLFRDAASTMMTALQTLNDLLQKGTGDFTPEVRKLHDLEHRADETAHRIISEMNATFITPIDREDIYALSSMLDDVIDLADETADTIIIDQIDTITPQAQQQGRILCEIGKELVMAIDQLESRKSIERHWIRVHELENQGDTITRAAIGELFRCTDPMYVIKWKDVYSLLEKTIDTCEDVANILESITIKNA